jgi:hypothetical protein
MNGLIAAAAVCSRPQDLTRKRNPVLLDLGGDMLLGPILTHFFHHGDGQARAGSISRKTSRAHRSPAGNRS